MQGPAPAFWLIKMDESKYNNLIYKLNGIIREDNESDEFFIKKGMSVESLSTNELFLVHVLLHKFYATGKNRELSMEDVEQLHSEVSKRIPHSRFDSLDD